MSRSGVGDGDEPESLAGSELCGGIEDASALVTYGWGMIPVTVRMGESEWTTSLWPKDGGYIVPLKLAVRRAEEVDVGDTVEIRLTLDV